jgi:hypothetical protein
MFLFNQLSPCIEEGIREVKLYGNDHIEGQEQQTSFQTRYSAVLPHFLDYISEQENTTMLSSHLFSSNQVALLSKYICKHGFCRFQQSSDNLQAAQWFAPAYLLDMQQKIILHHIGTLIRVNIRQH